MNKWCRYSKEKINLVSKYCIHMLNNEKKWSRNRQPFENSSDVKCKIFDRIDTTVWQRSSINRNPILNYVLRNSIPAWYNLMSIGGNTVLYHMASVIYWTHRAVSRHVSHVSQSGHRVAVLPDTPDITSITWFKDLIFSDTAHFYSNCLGMETTILLRGAETQVGFLKVFILLCGFLKP